MRHAINQRLSQYELAYGIPDFLKQATREQIDVGLIL
jgi:hypothetical protein